MSGDQKAILILHGGGLLELVRNFTYETDPDQTSCPDALDRQSPRKPLFALHCGGTIHPR